MCTPTCNYHDKYETRGNKRVIIRVCKGHGEKVIGSFKLSKRR
jgi:hypothetical protein